MIDLLDVNIWLALVDQRHVHHHVAHDYWSRHGAHQFAFCRTTMQGFLRLATNPRAVVKPKTNAEACKRTAIVTITSGACAVIGLAIATITQGAVV
jgi:predicted nucleic acid-binding protein